ncbi:MAG: hemerythrin family protein [Thermodesulfobacteria bacterium]|nr:hemerythrin family protein [Thermodesulfobacteriota bacterium]
MSFVLWKPCYCIGDSKIDNQHRSLVSLLNFLYDRVQAACPKRLIDRVLMELVRYAEEHFQDEEDLMERIGFPELEHHRREHERLLMEVFAFKEKFDHGFATKMELLHFLRDWLINHVIDEDLKIRRYL